MNGICDSGAGIFLFDALAKGFVRIEGELPDPIRDLIRLVSGYALIQDQATADDIAFSRSMPGRYRRYLSSLFFHRIAGRYPAGIRGIVCIQLR